MARKRTPYDTLGVDKSADADKIKSAHRKRVRETHPDRKGDAEEFKEVQSAYLVLIDPARRKRYDETGDDSESRTDSDANRLLAATFLQVVHQLIGQGMDVAKRDVFAAMIELFRKTVRELDSQIGQNQEAKRQLEQVAKRIKKEPAPSLFASIMQSELAKIESLNAGISKSKATYEEAIRHVEACKYEVDQTPGFTFSGPMGIGRDGPIFWTDTGS